LFASIRGLPPCFLSVAAALGWGHPSAIGKRFGLGFGLGGLARRMPIEHVSVAQVFVFFAGRSGTEKNGWNRIFYIFWALNHMRKAVANKPVLLCNLQYSLYMRFDKQSSFLCCS
jgi:hypothetical protein